MDMSEFEWDMAKEAVNVIKHGVDFSTAQLAFADPGRVIAEDLTHRQGEDRFYCMGRVGCDWFSWRLPFAFVGAALCGCPVVVSVDRRQPPH